MLLHIYIWSLTSTFVSVAEKYMKKLFGPNKDRMGVDQKAVLLVSKVNESKRHGERVLVELIAEGRRVQTG